MNSVRTVLERECRGRIRFDCATHGRWRVLCPADADQLRVLEAFQKSGIVSAGVEGWEYLRGVGRVQHVYALRCGRQRVRIVGPGVVLQGRFSNLRALEREVNV